MFKPKYHVCTNLRHQIAMATELHTVSPIICGPRYEIAICHSPVEVAPKILRNFCTHTIEHYFMRDVILVIHSSIMHIFMLLQKLRLDSHFFSKIFKRISGKVFRILLAVHK
jgi:hypothetical protein